MRQCVQIHVSCMFKKRKENRRRRNWPKPSKEYIRFSSVRGTDVKNRKVKKIEARSRSDFFFSCNRLTGPSFTIKLHYSFFFLFDYDKFLTQKYMDVVYAFCSLTEVNRTKINMTISTEITRAPAWLPNTQCLTLAWAYSTGCALRSN